MSPPRVQCRFVSGRKLSSTEWWKLSAARSIQIFQVASELQQRLKCSQKDRWSKQFGIFGLSDDLAAKINDFSKKNLHFETFHLTNSTPIISCHEMYNRNNATTKTTINPTTSRIRFMSSPKNSKSVTGCWRSFYF